MLSEQPVGPGECIHCRKESRDLIRISSTRFDSAGNYCSACAKIAWNIFKKRIYEEDEAIIGIMCLLTSIGIWAEYKGDKCSNSVFSVSFLFFSS